MRPSSAVSTLLFVLCLVGGVVTGVSLMASTDGRGNPALVAVPTIVGVVVGLLVSRSVKVVAQWERMIVLRLGKFSAIAEPGLRLLFPVFDTSIFVEMRIQTVNIQKQQAITQDNVPILVNGVIFFKVLDPESAILKVQDYRQAIWRLAQATLRDVVGVLSLDDVLSQQKRLESEITQSVEATSKAWGIHVEAIKIEDIDVPEELKKMMSRQASSEREKRATIIKAEGDRLASGALAEAALTMARSPGAMQLRTLQTLDGLGPSASNTVVLAIPLEVIELMRANIEKIQQS
jgi:regulator of protease activity HflC (stomatin/prohibitin superfamily)